MNKKSNIVRQSYVNFPSSRDTVSEQIDQLFTIKSVDKNVGYQSNRQNLPKTNQDSRCKQFMDDIRCYLKNSTLHGLNYVGNRRISYGERLFWFLAFLCAIGAATFFIVRLYTIYDINPVIISINPSETPASAIPFPAVTVCNMNDVVKTTAEAVYKNGSSMDKYFLADLCGGNDNSPIDTLDQTTEEWKNIFNFISRVSQPCEKFVKVCKWQKKEVDCKQFFNSILTADGLCCSFNLMPLDYILRDSDNVTIFKSTLNNYAQLNISDWNPEQGYLKNTPIKTYPRRSLGPGAHLGLTFVLDVDIDNYFCTSSNSAGVKMLLHNPVEYPKMIDYSFMLSPGNEVRVIFKPKINDASHTLRSIPVEKRHCYFSNERYLKYYRTYTTVNCKMECLANVTLRQCGCVPYYLPRNAKTKICSKMQEACSNYAREMVEFNLDSHKENRCNCLPACFHVDYEDTLSYGKIGDGYKMKYDYIKNESRAYFKKNMIVVHVYFVSTQFSKFTKSELYGFSEFLSNTGGVLGLFLGLSFLSVVELFYHLAFKTMCKQIRFSKSGLARNAK